MRKYLTLRHVDEGDIPNVEFYARPFAMQAESPHRRDAWTVVWAVDTTGWGEMMTREILSLVRVSFGGEPSLEKFPPFPVPTALSEGPVTKFITDFVAEKSWMLERPREEEEPSPVSSLPPGDGDPALPPVEEAALTAEAADELRELPDGDLDALAASIAAEKRRRAASPSI